MVDQRGHPSSDRGKRTGTEDQVARLNEAKAATGDLWDALSAKLKLSRAEVQEGLRGMNKQGTTTPTAGPKLCTNEHCQSKRGHTIDTCCSYGGGREGGYNELTFKLNGTGPARMMSVKRLTALFDQLRGRRDVPRVAH